MDLLIRFILYKSKSKFKTRTYNVEGELIMQEAIFGPIIVIFSLVYIVVLVIIGFFLLFKMLFI